MSVPNGRLRKGIWGAEWKKQKWLPTCNLCSPSFRLKSLSLDDFKRQMQRKSYEKAMICCTVQGIFPEKRLNIYAALMSIHVVCFWMFSSHSPLTLGVWNLFEESMAPGYLNSRVSWVFFFFLPDLKTHAHNLVPIDWGSNLVSWSIVFYIQFFN